MSNEMRLIKKNATQKNDRYVDTYLSIYFLTIYLALYKFICLSIYESIFSPFFPFLSLNTLRYFKKDR